MGAKTITATSYSRLKVFEQCALRAKMAYIDRIPEPQPMGETPASRGERIHKGSEAFIIGKAEKLPMEAHLFKTELAKLKDLLAAKRGEAEQMWCFDKDWNVVDQFDFANIWMRIKLDAWAWISDGWGALIDYKTGKREGNEVGHSEQTTLYAAGAFMKYPELEDLSAELWYFDKDINFKTRFTKNQALKHMKTWTDRALRMTTATKFPARPSTHNCAYCPFKTGPMGKSGLQGSGHCELNP